MKASSLSLKLNFAVFVLVLATCNSPALNVVGYVNIVMTNGWTNVVNQLGTANSNANYVITGAPPPDGTLLYRYDPVVQDFFNAATYIAGAWYPLSGNTNDSVLNLPLGEGFLIWSPRPWTATFVGEVAQGFLTNQIPLNYSLKGSMVPEVGLLQTDLEFPPDPGDSIWRGVPSALTNDSFNGTWFPSQPSVKVGESFFVHRVTTANHPWVRNFTVQFANRPAKAAPSELSDPAPRILNFTIQDGMVTLKVSKTVKPYNVQFSTDRENWTTIAANQTATTWQGPLPPSPRGFFQVTQP